MRLQCAYSSSLSSSFTSAVNMDDSTKIMGCHSASVTYFMAGTCADVNCTCTSLRFFCFYGGGALPTIAASRSTALYPSKTGQGSCTRIAFRAKPRKFMPNRAALNPWPSLRLCALSLRKCAIEPMRARTVPVRRIVGIATHHHCIFVSPAGQLFETLSSSTLTTWSETSTSKRSEGEYACRSLRRVSML